MESKVRKLCISQGFALGVKGLTNSTTVKYCSTAEWSHFRGLYMESKVRKLCITQGFTLGVKGLTNSTTVKYCSTAEWSYFRGLYMESKVRKLSMTQGFTLGVKGLKAFGITSRYYTYLNLVCVTIKYLVP